MGTYPYGHVFFGIDLEENDPGLDIYDFNDRDLPVEFVEYATSEVPSYGLAIKGSHQMNSWDDCQRFIYTKYSTEEIRKAAEFCEENGLPEFKDPKWLLTASYG